MEEKLSNLPQILAVCIKNLIIISFGMTLGFPTVLIPALQEDETNVKKIESFYLSKTEVSWISSINLIFVPLGCVLSGVFSSLIGRKRAMQFVCFPLFASWIIIYYSKNVQHLYLALALSGFTGGMLEAPVLTYVAEITTPEIRGLLAASASLCIILGVFSQFLMGLFIHWRIIAIVSTIAPVFAIIFLFFVPESPYWLIIKNREEDAKKSLMWLRGWLKNFDTVKQEFNQIEKSLKSSIDDDKETKNFKSFTNRSFLMPYLIVSLAFFIGHFSGMTTLQTYAVPIFAELKAPIDKYFATMLLGIVELSGTATCVILVRFVGKRKLTFISLVGCGLCFLSTAIYAYFIDKIPGKVAENNIISNVTRDSFNLSANSLELIATTTIESITIENFNSSIETSHEEIHSNQHSWIPLTLMLASAFLSHSGIRLLPWMLVGEVFPSKIRGVASGISGGTSYIFGFAANKTFLNMASTLTLSGTFLLYSCISIIGFIILLIILPETEGRTLQEIEDHFNGNQKLSKTLKRKEVVIMSEIPESPTKFEISKTSAEKFENYLKEHHIEPTKLNPIKNHVEHRLKTEQKNGKKVVFNDDDYDTSL